MKTQISNEDAEAIISMYMHIEKLREEGNSEEEIKKFLCMMGMQESEACLMLNQFEEHKAIQREAASDHITKGILWLLGGIAITGFTYSIASETGGTYYAMWGMAVYGLLRLGYGLLLQSAHQKAAE